MTGLSAKRQGPLAPCLVCALMPLVFNRSFKIHTKCSLGPSLGPSILSPPISNICLHWGAKFIFHCVHYRTQFSNLHQIFLRPWSRLQSIFTNPLVIFVDPRRRTSFFLCMLLVCYASSLNLHHTFLRPISGCQSNYGTLVGRGVGHQGALFVSLVCGLHPLHPLVFNGSFSNSHRMFIGPRPRPKFICLHQLLTFVASKGVTLPFLCALYGAEFSTDLLQFTLNIHWTNLGATVIFLL